MDMKEFNEKVKKKMEQLKDEVDHIEYNPSDEIFTIVFFSGKSEEISGQLPDVFLIQLVYGTKKGT